MSPAAAIFSTRFRAMLQYRAAALAGVFTQSFFGLVLIMVLEGFYRSSARPPAFDLGQAISYIWLGQVIFTLQPYNLDREVRNMVRDGTVAYELLRPLSLHTLWYSKALAWRSAPLVLRSLPMVAVAVLLLPALGLGDWALRPPASVAAGLLSLVGLLGALAVSAALTTLMTIGLLWTVRGEGMAVLLSSMAALLSGMIIPLPLMPGWAQLVLQILPFAALLDLPARIYTGALPAAAGWWVPLHQFGWAAALVGLGRVLLARRLRALVIHGG